MKPLNRLFLKVFIYYFIGFIIIMTGFNLILSNEINFKLTILTGLVSGLFVSLSLRWYYSFYLRKRKTQNLREEDIKVVQEKNITSSLSKDDLIDLIKADPYFSNAKITASDDHISMKTGIDWRTWGEKIKIECQPINGSGQYQYMVISRPKLSTTIIDYGKNLDNVNRIVGILEGAKD